MGIAFGAFFIFLVSIFFSATDNDRTWRDKELQEDRKRWAENGWGERYGPEEVARKHKQYGYRFDPWFPSLREKIIEAEKLKNSGKSLTEIAEKKYGIM